MTQPDFDLKFIVSGSVGFQMMQLGEEGQEKYNRTRNLVEIALGWIVYYMAMNVGCVILEDKQSYNCQKKANDELHKLKDTYKLTKSTNKGLATLQIVFTLHVKEVFCTFSVNKFPLCLGLHLSLPTEVFKT